MRYMHSIPGSVDGELDGLFKEAVEIVTQYDRASASLIQRRLSIGYARAARLIDQLEAAGVIGPAEGSLPGDVLIQSYEEFAEKGGKSPSKEEEDPFKVPANYKAPTGIKFSKTDEMPWGTLFSDALNRSDFKDRKAEFPLHLGFDDAGKLYTESLLDVKNLIIAGNPPSQKEKLVDTFLLTYLLRYTPTELRFILNNPTHYLDLYNGIPHLLSPVINDYSKAISALRWSADEMQRRMKLFAEAGVRDISSYNKRSEAIPHILVVTFLDSFYVENIDMLTLLTGRGIRTGIHNIVVVDQTTGESLPRSIKSNIPARVGFRLSSASDSKAIDVLGGENLQLGEIVYKPNFDRQVRLKAIFTPETNVKEVVEAVKQASTYA
jgi:S-DNA-T family DNA segregation ATPase FtsK/SpoIIIE